MNNRLTNTTDTYDPFNNTAFIVTAMLDSQRRPYRPAGETYGNGDGGAISAIVPVVLFTVGVSVALYAMAVGGF